MLTVAEAGARILAAATPLAAETVALAEAHRRFLAAAITATRALPAFDNSAMDGFAVRAADLPGRLPITGVIAAGDAPTATLAAGTAMRIMTGAPVPRGADAVVMREQADDLGDAVDIALSPRAGEHIRRAGEDVATGAEVLAAGDRLGPGELAVCAALGRGRVSVARRPRVAILSSGDELVDVDTEPGPGQIVSSNAYAIAAQIRDAGGLPWDLGIVGDDPAALRERVDRGLGADVLVTSGGVSAGDFDYVRDTFTAAGVNIAFWKVAMKPGKPLTFGVARSGGLVFGLPGNPVSSMVAFELFARPALLALQGARTLHRPRATVRLTCAYDKQPGRTHYVRAQVVRRGRELVATPLAHQGSGMLSSMVGVDALVEIDRDAGRVAAGAEAPALLLRAV